MNDSVRVSDRGCVREIESSDNRFHPRRLPSPPLPSLLFPFLLFLLSSLLCLTSLLFILHLYRVPHTAVVAVAAAVAVQVCKSYQ